MAPKREPEATLPGDDRFGGDYSDAKRAQVVRSDGARKRGARKYSHGGSVRCDLPEFDRLRREREREIDRRRREKFLRGASSSSAAPGAPPPEGYDPEHYGVTLGPSRVAKNIYLVFKCFGQHFCLHFEAFLLGMSPVYMAFLRFMGEESEARNFCYSLEVGGNGRKLTWQGTPRSIRDGHKKVRDSFDGLIIHRNMALFFSSGTRQELKLRVTGRIWKEQ